MRLLCQAGTRLQIPARAKVAMRTMEHGHPRLRVGVKGQERRVQLARRVGIDRVAHRGAVQRYHRHGAVSYGFYRVRHKGPIK